MRKYDPKPIDTAHVRLPAEVVELTERLAENAHDVWARGKLRDGWTYGPETDPAARRHQDLVPYAELSEGSRDYDRATAMETLKAILALGYRITRA